MSFSTPINTNQIMAGSGSAAGYTGTVNQTGGTVSFGTGNALLVGNGSANGIYNLSNGNLIYVGATSTTRGVMLGVNTGTNATFNLSGTGSLNLLTSQGTLMVGRSDDNTVTGNTVVYNQTGGTATVQTLTIGGRTLGSAGVNATFSVTGGTFSAAAFGIGVDGTTAGLSRGNTNTSVINIGGTAVVTLPAFPTLRGTSSTATINFDGGTLKNSAASAAYMGGLTNAFIKSGGAQFDTANGNITVSQALLTHGSSLGGGLTKIGANTLTLTSANTYTGTTTVSTGTLALSGAGSIASSSLVRINSTLDVTTVTGNFTMGATQTFGGSGTIVATGKTVVANGTLSPGNSPGTLTQDGGNLQLGANGNMNWQIHNASGAAGTGYDTVNLINGATLDLSLLSVGNEYNINLWSLSGIGPDVNGNATNFDNTQNYAWTLFSTGTAITGFNTNKFDINITAFNGTNGFTNLLGGGSFSVGLGDSNTDLMLNFTAIPEPKAALLGCLGVLLLLRRRR